MQSSGTPPLYGVARAYCRRAARSFILQNTLVSPRRGCRVGCMLHASSLAKWTCSSIPQRPASNDLPRVAPPREGWPSPCPGCTYGDTAVLGVDEMRPEGPKRNPHKFARRPCVMASPSPCRPRGLPRWVSVGVGCHIALMIFNCYSGAAPCPRHCGPLRLPNITLLCVV